MEDKLISRYDILVNRYKELVSEKLSRKDFIEYNEILFSAHSCAIEGNSFSVDETRTLKEKGLGMIPKGKTLLEAFEILDHFQAYEYLLKNLDRPLTEELLKETHRLLTEHTLSYKTQYDEIPSNPGEYTTVDMCAGDTIFGDHEQLIKQVPRLLQSTQQVLDSGKIHPMIIAARFHGFYEYLHPFRDGNGRLGRLMSNFILLKKEQPLLIIPGSQREEYITALKYIKKERTDEFLIDFFFRTSIKRMEQEIEEKKNLTENFIRGMEFVRNVKSSNDDISEIVLNLSPDDENLERGGYLISPEPESGWKYGEDEWYVNGNGIPSGQYGQYLFTYNDYSRYPDGSRFVYDFKADNSIKVTIQTGMWSNNSFSLYTHGDFRIGFSATGLSSGQQTREFSYGDRVTIYADGADYAVPGEGDRWRYNYLRGFFTTRWQALDDLGEYSQTSAGSYSFTATKDITINIVFMPTIR